MLPKTFEDAFEGKRNLIIQKMRADINLLTLLLDHKLINNHQHDKLEAQHYKTPDDQNSALLKELTRADDREVKTFLEDLVTDNQRHVVNLIVGRETTDTEFVNLPTESRRQQESTDSPTVEKDNKPREEHAACVRRLKNVLLFTVSSVAAEMFQCGALTWKELEKIRTSRGDIEAAEILLDILEKSPREVFDCFLQALRHTKQEHVYQQIIDQEFSASTAHYFLMRNNYLYLLDKMDTKHSLLTAHLYDCDVLSLREKEDIQAELTSTRQNEKLLSMLSHKSAEQWGLFLTALDNTGQEHIRRHITGEADTADRDRDDVVCEVNDQGHVIRVYNYKLVHPAYLSLDSDGRVFVADCFKPCVLLLSSDLKREQGLLKGTFKSTTETVLHGASRSTCS